MAKLFSKEYHEYSNTWHFKSRVMELAKNDLKYEKFFDEKGNIVLRFEATENVADLFQGKLVIVYNKKKRKIINHNCSICKKQNCFHFLTVLNYAFKYLSTEDLQEDAIQTYQSNLLNYNEFWQRTVLNSKIEISEIFNENSDKIRFHYESYTPFRIRLISILAAGKKLKNEDQKYKKKALKQMRALSKQELDLLESLQNKKCAYSRKNMFFSIYKKDFVDFLPLVRNLENKIYIKRTGDKIKFEKEKYHTNFHVSRIDENNYLMKSIGSEKFSAIYSGKTTYLFIRNKVYHLRLPFSKETTEALFSDGLDLKKSDLVYISSVITRQLSLIKCYIDFADEIEIPESYHNTPIIVFNLQKEANSISMVGRLKYDDKVSIPMASVRLPTDLVRFDQNNVPTWFYIPPQTKYEIFKFIDRLPPYDDDQIETMSKLIFSGEKHKEQLKKSVFEYAKPEWDINLSDELKNEFIYKVNLKPEIKAHKGESIEWFEYEVEYNYKDINFTHDELKQFFKTKEKFYKLDDGRILYFDNIDAFQDVDKILKDSKRITDSSYKLSIYNLPYIYQLSTINKGIQTHGDQYLENMFEDILDRKREKEYEVPSFLKPIMRSYQKAGYQWLRMLAHYGLSGILADDMGLGKTLQAISVLTVLPKTALSIVICPKTLLFNWGEEIDKFNSNLSYIMYEGTIKQRKDKLKNLNTNIILASYSIVQNDIEILEEMKFDYIILDEAQHIKNTNTLRTKAVKKLNSKFKMCLTGTPLENNPSELWSLFDFLMPGFLPSQRKFKKNILNDGDNSYHKHFKMMISPFILRRKKKDVLIELPDKQIQTVYAKPSGIQEKIYLQILDRIQKKYFQSKESFEIKKKYFNILAALTKLRLVCDHPKLVEEEVKDEIALSGKMEALEELIIDAIDSNKKLLVFSQFVKMLKIVKKMLKDNDISFEYMDGSTRNRKEVIDNFNNNTKIRILLSTLKTGGYGINLTAADTVIILDPWWNPMTEIQAIDRAHRIGQTKKVMVYKMITKGTIEEKILNLQQKKWNLFENLIEDGQSLVKSLDVDELKNLLEYKQK